MLVFRLSADTNAAIVQTSCRQQPTHGGPPSATPQRCVGDAFTFWSPSPSFITKQTCFSSTPGEATFFQVSRNTCEDTNAAFASAATANVTTRPLIASESSQDFGQATLSHAASQRRVSQPGDLRCPGGSTPTTSFPTILLPHAPPRPAHAKDYPRHALPPAPSSPQFTPSDVPFFLPSPHTHTHTHTHQQQPHPSSLTHPRLRHLLRDSGVEARMREGRVAGQVSVSRGRPSSSASPPHEL
ncbi:hypothetical protein E2C01_011926 [Portunus trituberculatus]|uniref:Uncharacterized protein n=1 Tax=Portunus trituberculatus TaxID=210409 RepID=A0A5B7DC75_PORTR|nr:hypothetical protein [Portunus trituberculatus]